MRSIVLVGVLGGLLAGCSSQVGQEAPHALGSSTAPVDAVASAVHSVAPHALSQIASLPDRGSFVAYVRPAEVRGASTWHEVRLSEARALRAMAEGGMVVQAPYGQPIRLRYQRHLEHADGNWTWVGRPAGAKPGVEAILTFGENAVFGTIPDGHGGSIDVTTLHGRTWMVQTDPRQAAASPFAADADMLQAPVAAATRAAQASRPVATASAAKPSVKAEKAPAAAMATVDLVLGYTTGFATRLGGQSQAVTRLNFIVDVANQALFNSVVGGQLRLVRTVQVDYPDATTNRSTLLELSGVQCTTTSGAGQMYLPDSGVNCTRVAPPAALQPLLNARVQYGADLAALVRIFSVPENQSCGVAWVLGGAQTAITPANAEFGLSVISDSSGNEFPDNNATCRNETLAHELGHNMGLVHDVTSAAGSDDTNSDGNLLDPEEFGRFADSFGYSTDSAHGNFFTIMSVPQAGQSGFRIFANPNLTSCGGFACGLVGQADNARSLGQTMPIVAAFRAPMVPVAGVWYRGDYNGDGVSDVLWHNASTSANSIWRSANLATPQAVDTVASTSWVILGAGDFDGDGKSDILWRNITTGANSIWNAANVATAHLLTPITDQAWQAVGVGDFNGDGKDDILWRNVMTGADTIWRSGSSTTPQAVTRVGDTAWTVVAVADFDADGKDDILWRNTRNGANSIWKSGNSATLQVLAPVTDLSWTVVGAGDFDGDGKADILWRNARTGANSIWKSGNVATLQTITAVPSQAWMVVGIGDFDGDGKDDILWRNSTTGWNSIWKSGNSATIQTMTTVPSQSWFVAG
jgi:hypothetical protein